MLVAGVTRARSPLVPSDCILVLAHWCVDCLFGSVVKQVGFVSSLSGAGGGLMTCHAPCDSRGLAPGAPLGASPRRSQSRSKGLVSTLFSPLGLWNSASGPGAGGELMTCHAPCDRRGLAPGALVGASPRRSQGRSKELVSNFSFAAEILEFGFWPRRRWGTADLPCAL